MGSKLALQGSDCCSPSEVSRFVNNLNKEQLRNTVNDEHHTLDDCSRRLVFVSLVGLYRTYRQCPMLLLYPALFILPIKCEDIKPGAKLKSTIFAECSIFADKQRLREFLQLLRWKQSQGLLFCLLSEYHEESAAPQAPIAPFFLHCSRRFKELSLNGLECTFSKPPHFQSKYGVEYSEVLKELCVLTMRFATLQEIVFQSNPNTLNPITAYTPTCGTCTIANRADADNSNVFVACVIDRQPGVWWIANDYDDLPMNEP